MPFTWRGLLLLLLLVVVFRCSQLFAVAVAVSHEISCARPVARLGRRHAGQYRVVAGWKVRQLCQNSCDANTGVSRPCVPCPLNANRRSPAMSESAASVNRVDVSGRSNAKKLMLSDASASTTGVPPTSSFTTRSRRNRFQSKALLAPLIAMPTTHDLSRHDPVSVPVSALRLAPVS